MYFDYIITIFRRCAAITLKSRLFANCSKIRRSLRRTLHLPFVHRPRCHHRVHLHKPTHPQTRSCRHLWAMPIVTRNILYRRPLDFTTELPPERTVSPLTRLITPSGLSYPFLSPLQRPQDCPSRQPFSSSNRP